jgi:putative methanogenesis marker protein 6
MVILAEDADVTPGQLVSWARSLGEPVQLKETCYGLLVEGEKEAVERTVAHLRSKTPTAIFSKERGYRIQDESRCRSGGKRSIRGGPRHGFHQLELESGLLADLGVAEECILNGESAPAAQPHARRLGEAELRKLVDRAVDEVLL